MNNDFLPMTTAELMDRAIHVYKKSFGRQLGFAAIWGIVSYLAFFLIGIVAAIVIAIFALSFSAITPLNYTATSGIFSAMLLIAAIVLPLVLLWQSVSAAGHILISKSAFYGRKENLPVGQLPRIALRVFGALIAQALASVPFILLIYAGFASGFFSFLLYATPWFTPLLFALLSLVLLISFLLYLNMFSLSVAVAAFERKTFFNALMRSWELIRGEFWKVAGMRLLWIVIIGVIASSVSGLFIFASAFAGLLSGLFDFAIDDAVFGIITAVSGLLSFAVMFAITPLDGIFQATLYFNQRIKKEGLDIEARLEKLLAERPLS